MVILEVRADDEVLAAARSLPALGITHRRTTISTVGWMPGLSRFVDELELEEAELEELVPEVLDSEDEAEDEELLARESLR